MLSIGSVIGSLAVGLVPHPRRVYLLAAVIAFGVCLALTAVAPDVPLACVALLLTGARLHFRHDGVDDVGAVCADPAYRGRVMALWVFVYIGTTPLGSALTGWVSSASGPRTALWLGVAACARRRSWPRGCTPRPTLMPD